MTSTNANRLLRVGLLGLAVALLAPWARPAFAAGCTPGVDCFCNKVSDPALLICEDFESPDYYLNTANSFAATSPNGPGGGGNRGNVSTWFKQWFNGVNGSLYHSSDPTPRIGTACTYPNCQGTREYCSPAQGNLADGKGADCWGPGVNASAPIDIQRSGDINAEVPSLTLTGGTGTSTQVGAGNQHLALRVGPGQTSGTLNMKKFTCGGGGCTEVGVTMLMAYSSNSVASGVWAKPWKHEEWGQSSANSFWTHGNTGAGGDAQLPYRPFLFMKSPYAQSACDAVVRGATVNRGLWGCNGVALTYAADPNYYYQPRDWPWGTWACTRAHIKGLGTTSGQLQIWHNETLIVDIANIDFTAIQDQYFGAVGLNSYANTNQGFTGDVPTNQTTYRYLDNFYVRNGVPVSCATVGWGTGSTPPPPDQTTATPPVAPHLDN